MLADSIFEKDIRFIREALRDKKISCAELIEEAVKRHNVVGDDLNAYKYWNDNRALEEAKNLDSLLSTGRDLGTLMGIPVSLKDLYGVRGMPICAGSPKELPQKWRKEGPVTSSLRASGGVVMGKTHTVEFAYGGVGTNYHWGAPVNPWDIENHRVSGGSSSGAGVSLCEGSALLAMGTDTGGSVRIPASVTGNVGLKVTINRWSTRGIVPLSSSFDTPGVLTKSVADAIMAFGVIDPFCDDADALFNKCDRAALSDFNIAICDDYFWNRCIPSIDKSVREAVAELCAKGAKVSSIDLPEANLARESSLKGGIFGVEGQSFIEEYFPNLISTLDPNVADRFSAASGIVAKDYLKSIRRISGLAREANKRLQYIDAIIAPTIPVTPPTIEQVKGSAAYKTYLGQMTQNTHPANLLEMCAITLPVGLDRAGMPIGMQLIARGGCEDRLLGLALACEKVLGTGRNRIGIPPRCRE